MNGLRKEITYTLADKSVLSRGVGDVADQILGAILQALPEEKKHRKEHTQVRRSYDAGYNVALTEVKEILTEALSNTPKQKEEE